MQAGGGWRKRCMVLLSLVMLSGSVLVAGGMSTTPAGAAGTGSAPGITKTQITTGAVGTLSGALAADFSDLVPGVKAYFDMVNASGGINGRKLVLAYNLDDQGSPSQFTADARTLVDQDHVFAVTGVSSPWFTPDSFRGSGLPIYGYNVTGNWAGPDYLFAAGGSTQCYTCEVPAEAYNFSRAKASSAAFLAYNDPVSADACKAASSLFQKAGIKVSYVNLDVPIDGNILPSVQAMQRAGSNWVMSCMDSDENVALAKAVSQYGLKMTQLWLNGADQGIVDKYSNYLGHVYMSIASVPFTAPTRYYPGLAAYLNAMRKYEPAYIGAALAVQGWETGALFAAGVRAAGANPTPARVIQATNMITRFTADGISPVTNWKIGHTLNSPIGCNAFVKVKGKQIVSTLAPGHQVFVCFGRKVSKDVKPVTPPSGTPGTGA